MCQSGPTRPIDRDRTRDGGPWLVLGLVTVRTPEGVLFGRLQARAESAGLKANKGQ